MGGTTNFSIDIEADNKPDIIKRLEEISGYGFEDPEICLYYDNVNWFDYLEHLETVSKEFPEAMIEVERNGAEQDDWYKIYATHGSVFEAPVQVHFPSFEEAKAHVWRIENREQFKV